jgi:hypothetical protein
MDLYIENIKISNENIRKNIRRPPKNVTKLTIDYIIFSIEWNFAIPSKRLPSSKKR